MTDILELKACTVAETYEFMSAKGPIFIIFQNGIFNHAIFPMTGKYTLQDWAILGAINDKINALIEAKKGGVK